MSVNDKWKMRNGKWKMFFVDELRANERQTDRNVCPTGGNDA
jgi:hypothetical protein